LQGTVWQKEFRCETPAKDWASFLLARGGGGKGCAPWLALSPVAGSGSSRSKLDVRQLKPL
jgi:hypothetical protein